MKPVLSPQSALFALALTMAGSSTASAQNFGDLKRLFGQKDREGGNSSGSGSASENGSPYQKSFRPVSEDSRSREEGGPGTASKDFRSKDKTALPRTPSPVNGSEPGPVVTGENPRSPKERPDLKVPFSKAANTSASSRGTTQQQGAENTGDYHRKTDAPSKESDRKGFGGLSVDDLRSRIGSIKLPSSGEEKAGPDRHADSSKTAGPAPAKSPTGRAISIGERTFTPVPTRPGPSVKEDWKIPDSGVVAAAEVKRKLGLVIPASHDQEAAARVVTTSSPPGSSSQSGNSQKRVKLMSPETPGPEVSRAVEVRVSVATPRTTEFLLSQQARQEGVPGQVGSPHATMKKTVSDPGGAFDPQRSGAGRTLDQPPHGHGPGSGAPDSYAFSHANGGGFSAAAEGSSINRGGIKIQPLDSDEKSALLEVPVYQDLNASFSNILFVVGSTEFANGSSLEQLNVIARVMRDEPAKKFLIEGHASDEGEEDANLRLSVARAAAVEQHLLDRGVRPEQLVGLGYGEYDQEYPVSGFEPAYEREQKRHLNRRVVVRVQAE